MRLRTAPRRVGELASVIRAAGRLYGAPPRATLRRVRRMRRDGWEYREALEAGALDPRVSEATVGAFVSRHRRREAQTRLNPLALEPLTEQKVITHAYCAAMGIPVPRLYGGLGRAARWSDVSGRVLDGTDDVKRFLLTETPDSFVVKPAAGHHGLGVRLVERAQGVLRQEGRGPIDARVLDRELRADPEFDMFVVEERLRDIEELQRFSPARALQTLRIATLVREDGTVALMHATLKLAVGPSASDNYRSGATGNGLAIVDLPTGRLGPLLLARPDGAGAVESATVPTSGCPVEGWRVPLFDEACELVRRWAPAFLPLRTLGWDVALTARGPVVVETNNYWGAMFIPLSSEARALLLGPGGPRAAQPGRRRSRNA